MGIDNSRWLNGEQKIIPIQVGGRVQHSGENQGNIDGIGRLGDLVGSLSTDISGLSELLINSDDDGKNELTKQLSKLHGEILAENQELKSIIDSSRESILILNREFIVVDANRTFFEQSGFKKEEVIGKHCYEVTHNSSRKCVGPRDQCPADPVLSGQKTSHEYLHMHKNRDGTDRFDRVAVGTIQGSNLLFHMARDVTSRITGELYAELVQMGTDPYLILNSGGKIVNANPAFYKMLGIDVENDQNSDNNPIISKQIADYVTCEDRERFSETILRKQSGTFVFKFNAKYGNIRIFELKITNYNKSIEATLISMQDITSHVQEKEAAYYAASHDSLTGLPNRELMKERLALEIERAMRSGESLAVGFKDLRGFKGVNDENGHEFGDRALITSGQRMLASTRQTDITARLGGDEFVTILPEIGNIESATQTMNNIIDEVSQEIIFDGKRGRIALNIGIAIFTPSKKRNNRILKNKGESHLQGRERNKILVNHYVDQLLNSADHDQYVAKTVSKAIRSCCEIGLNKIINLIKEGKNLESNIKGILLEAKKGLDPIAKNNTTTTKELQRAISHTQHTNYEVVIDKMIAEASSLIKEGEYEEGDFKNFADDLIIQNTSTIRIVDGKAFKMTPKDDRGETMELRVEVGNLAEQNAKLVTMVDELVEQNIRFQTKGNLLEKELIKVKAQLLALQAQGKNTPVKKEAA